ncbi:MAG: glycoside hydrolase family 43 C-terminal domain-containing protein [Zavarzinella sp.]
MLRTILLGIVCLLVLPPAFAQKGKITAKTFVGKWKVITTNHGKASDIKEEIEFKEDGTFEWKFFGTKTGTYELKGNALHITQKGMRGAIIWSNFKQLKDGNLEFSPTIGLVKTFEKMKD